MERIARTLGQLRRHPLISSVLGLGIFGLFDLFSHVDVAHKMIVQFLGQDWYSTGWMKLVYAAAIIWGLWRIGYLAERGSKEAHAKETAARSLVIDPLRALVSNVARERQLSDLQSDLREAQGLVSAYSVAITTLKDGGPLPADPQFLGAFDLNRAMERAADAITNLYRRIGLQGLALHLAKPQRVQALMPDGKTEYPLASNQHFIAEHYANHESLGRALSEASLAIEYEQSLTVLERQSIVSNF